MNIQPVAAGSSTPGIEPRAAVRGRGAPSAAGSAQEVVAPGAPTGDQIREAARALHAAVQPMARELRFSFDADPDTGRMIVRVIDAHTREVIRQIPAEELLAMSRAIGRGQGLLLQKSA